MDGVPGVSFPGIKAGQTFVYEFPVKQSGTYWYHSHSGMQEAMGMYGAIVIDPAGPDPVAYDREHVIMLADWSFIHPHTILRKLKAQGGYFNMQKQTLCRVAGRQGPVGLPNGGCGQRCGWTRPTFPTSPDRPIISGQRPRQRRELDRTVRAGRAGAPADHQCLGHDQFQRADSGPGDDGGRRRWAERAAGRDRRIPDRHRRDL
jgi:FtsP/CotA-like multicopper oxidase with cupredoxin domain